MRREFCTLFDANYLLKGVALYRSLESQGADFRLWVLCMDDEAHDVLGGLDLPRAELIRLADLEDPELTAIKPERSRGEYCWTLTPSLPLYILGRHPDIGLITYLDADLYFFGDPEAIFDELGDASIGLVEHRYSDGLANMAATHGIYNVECMVFRNNEVGLSALRWWRARCIEWCFNRVEDGKFGDQKYLDDWPQRFSGVRVLKAPGIGLAPWNIQRYRVEAGPEGLTVDGERLVFYHFHQFALLDDGAAYRPDSTGFVVTPRELAQLYDPYADALRTALLEARTAAPGFSAGIESRTPGDRMNDALQAARRRLRAARHPKS